MIIAQGSNLIGTKPRRGDRILSGVYAALKIQGYEHERPLLRRETLVGSEKVKSETALRIRQK